MTIASEVTRIQTNIASAYTACSDKGATMPDTQNSANLADTITSIPTGGGGDIPEGQYRVRFYDYDGTILSTQIGALGTTLTVPANPSHDNLVFSTWNQSVPSTIDGHRDIGAIYTTVDDKNYLKVTANSTNGMTLNFGIGMQRSSYTTQTVGYSIDYNIDYGDGTVDSGTFNGTIPTIPDASTYFIEFLKKTHTYSTEGNYTVSISTQKSSGSINEVLLFGNFTGTVNGSPYKPLEDSTEASVIKISDFIYTDEDLLITELYMKSTMPMRNYLGCCKNLTYVSVNSTFSLYENSNYYGTQSNKSTIALLFSRNGRIKHLNFPTDSHYVPELNYLESCSFSTPTSSSTYFSIYLHGVPRLKELVIPPCSSNTYNLSIYNCNIDKIYFKTDDNTIGNLLNLINSKVDWIPQFNKFKNVAINGIRSKTPVHITSTVTNLTFNTSGNYSTQPSSDETCNGRDGYFIEFDANASYRIPSYAFNTAIGDNNLSGTFKPTNLADGCALNYLTKLMTLDLSLTSLTSIGTMYNCYQLRKIIFPNTLTTLSSYGTFQNTYSLQVVEFPATITTLNLDTSFKNSGVNKVILNQNTLSTGFNNAFENCKNLKEVICPASATYTLSSVSSAFKGCYALNKIPDILKHVTTWKNAYQMFYDCIGLTEFEFPSTLTSITDSSGYMFYNCKNITKVWIPSTLTTINANSYSYSLFYGINKSNTPTVHIYCEATEKPSGWGSYWNYYNSSNPIPSSQIHWGATYEDYQSA